MKNKSLKNYGLLLLTAFIWGSAFVAQSVGMDYIRPFTFSAVRNYIGVLALLPVVAFLTSRRKKAGLPIKAPDGKVLTEAQYRHNTIIGGIACGFILFVAAILQQYGIADPTVSVGKAGFITALYVVLVPVASIFVGKKPKWFLWLCVAMSLVGLYLLCVKPGESLLDLGRGDVMLLLCAVTFTGHIVCIDHFSPKSDGVMMSAIQFLVCAIISTIFMFIFDHPQLSAILQCALPLLYAGVLSSGVAYTLQIVAQKDANPTIASMIMCLESVFSAVCGWIILSQALSGREIIGCIMMFVAIIIAQLL